SDCLSYLSLTQVPKKRAVQVQGSVHRYRTQQVRRPRRLVSPALEGFNVSCTMNVCFVLVFVLPA
ncbi:hypothetical protein JMJ77_0005350, partial [Colletotrichum scovillei]